MDAAAFATATVRALTGDRWTWPRRTITEQFEVRTRTLHLSGRPVTATGDIASVHDYNGDPVLDSDGVTPGWSLANGFILALTKHGFSQVRGYCGSTLDVTYTYGAPPPGYITTAIDVLANELLLSDSSDCRLPDRVTSVSRQGLSWTVIDPQDFLDQGRTGIYEVDLAIRLANPGGARARTRVFSPERLPPRRIG